MNKLIHALRCTGTIGATEELKCEECPYHIVEEIEKCYKSMADFEKDGKFFVNACDTDKILLDAADRLEEFQKKHVPIKPKMKTQDMGIFGTHTSFVCGCCEAALRYRYEYNEPIDKFCWECGNIIEWGDGE